MFAPLDVVHPCSEGEILDSNCVSIHINNSKPFNN